MWVFMKNSFLSIVTDTGNPDSLLVRARKRGDIEAVFPEAVVLALKNHDYRFRAYLSRARVQAVLSEQVGAIDYKNFKDEVQAVSGSNRHDAYLNVWSCMWDWQRKTP
jgi:hypothetical protein